MKESIGTSMPAPGMEVTSGPQGPPRTSCLSHLAEMLL